MGRPRSETREKAFRLWLESGGIIKLVDLAAELGISDSKIRKWKAIDKWDQKLKGALQQNEKGSVLKRPGAPKGNKNAVGHGAPKQNKNAERHGFLSRIFPDDPETQAILAEISIKSPLDILWENIIIQYTAIVRAQKLMWVRDKDDLTKVLKREKIGQTSEETEWELQYAWDKHASFLKAQSRAISALQNLIRRYEELLPGTLQHEEQRLRVEKLKAEITGLASPDDGSLAELAKALRESESEAQ